MSEKMELVATVTSCSFTSVDPKTGEKRHYEKRPDETFDDFVRRYYESEGWAVSW